MKKLFNLLITALLLMGLLTALTACQEEKSAGEKIEDAIEDVGDGLEDAADEVGDAVDDLKDEIEGSDG